MASRDHSHPVLEARGLQRRAPDGSRWLLHDVSLQLWPGERLALVGPTGSGKTLLLRSLALLDPIDAGAVLWHGRPITRVPEYRARVIYLHQRPALFEGDVEANLQLPFRLRTHQDKKFDRARILAVLSTFDRDAGFLARAQADLSGGEAQVVALLRAMQLDPEALLLDEPTAALDLESVALFERLLEQWWAQGDGERALVWVSHSPEQVARVADRTLSIRNGRLVEMP